MKITAAQVQEITPLVRAAVQLQIASWRFQGQIEQMLGIYFENMEMAIADLAAAGDPATIQDEEVQIMIKGLRIEL